MAEKVDLYDNAYSKFGSDVYEKIRIETYGHDLGQTSWVTNEESEQIPLLLELTSGCRVLEIGCGSGRYALRVVETAHCHLLGLDINPHGVHIANELARSKGLSSLASFEQCDVSVALPCEDESFDAVFANDALCHIAGRPAVLKELFRVLKPGGRLLFSDALVVGGLISHEEIAIRSSIGYYVFSPLGINEQLIRSAGFHLISANDTTSSAAAIAGRWNDARQQRKDQLVASEGKASFEGLQQFLTCVHQLTLDRRLLRYVYLGRKVA